jgi:hypothetical protein
MNEHYSSTRLFRSNDVAVAVVLTSAWRTSMSKVKIGIVGSRFQADCTAAWKTLALAQAAL